jgi:hypothetical protein
MLRQIISQTDALFIEKKKQFTLRNKKVEEEVDINTQFVQRCIATLANLLQKKDHEVRPRPTI